MCIKFSSIVLSLKISGSKFMSLAQLLYYKGMQHILLPSTENLSFYGPNYLFNSLKILMITLNCYVYHYLKIFHTGRCTLDLTYESTKALKSSNRDVPSSILLLPQFMYDGFLFVMKSPLWFQMSVWLFLRKHDFFSYF